MSFERLQRRQPQPPARGPRSYRLGCVAAVFLVSMAAVSVQLADLAAQKPKADPDADRTVETRMDETRADEARTDETRTDETGDAAVAEKPRGAIYDRHGAPLALNAPVFDIYLDTAKLLTDEDREEAVEDLVALFPDALTPASVREKIAKGKTPRIRRGVGPRTAQAVHDLGSPAIYPSRRIDRMHPAGRVTAHALGYVNLAGDGVAGLEAGLNAPLAQAKSTYLSLDLRAQTIVHDALSRAMTAFDARAAAGLVMHARTGEIYALVSLPDYAPWERETEEEKKLADGSRFFHRAAQGLYEFGSTFKIFTWALAFEAGIVEPDDELPAPKTFTVDGQQVRDLYPIRRPVTVAEAFAKSSNIVAAQLALKATAPAQRALYKALGLTQRAPVEVLEARAAEPPQRSDWRPALTAVASYGYGVQVTPVHLAAAVATVVNDGRKVTPTLLRREGEAARTAPLGPQVISARTSQIMRRLLRQSVTDGGGRLADVRGLDVGGKTGTSEKIDPETRRYVDDRVVASFVAAFPIHDPEFVVLVTLDEAADRSGGEPVRLAGRTAAPVAGEIIARIAPFLRAAAGG